MKKLFAIGLAAMMLTIPAFAEEADYTGGFIPAEIDYEADLALLQGKWSACKVGTKETFTDITPENETYMEMEIEGTTVTMNGFYFENAVYEMDNQDGGLSRFFDDESEMFEIIAINYLTDGTLRLNLVASLEQDEEIQYLFVPAEEMDKVSDTETAAEDTAATSEQTWEASGNLEDGIYTISIKATGIEKEGWHWENYTGDKGDATLFEVLTDTTQEEGYAYVGSFRAIENEGTDTIRLVHTDGYVVDEYMDFDIRIEDGKIAEITGGSHALPAKDEELAEVICKTWQDAADNNTFLSLTLNPAGGFDGMISDGSGRDGKTAIYTFTAGYDIISRALKYKDGGFHETAITTGEEETEAPAAESSGGAEGLIAFDPASEDEEHLQLILHDEKYTGGEDMTFVKAE